MITHVVAKTLVFDDEGKLLLLKRSANDEHRPGGLDLPGGKVEEGEDIITGAIREALEEAGLAIAPADLHWVYADTAATYNTDAKTKVNLVRVTFAAHVSNPQVRLSHEHDAFSWHTIDEAMELVTGSRFHEVLSHVVANNLEPEMWKGNQ
jgi:8-oxo-dGTP diphosphatase